MLGTLCTLILLSFHTSLSRGRFLSEDIEQLLQSLNNLLSHTDSKRASQYLKPGLSDSVISILSAASSPKALFEFSLPTVPSFWESLFNNSFDKVNDGYHLYPIPKQKEE